ncbi:MAG: hypothetical protein LC747_06900, partial [Acidobacteria bacterium]|nr:hypothetical protein [Acidobacteriota bacterium]
MRVTSVARVAGKIVLSALMFFLLCPLIIMWAQPKTARASVRSLPEIRSRAEFDALSRINTDAGYPLPHVMYVIDRKDKNKIYYVNSKRYRFHKDFVNGTY